MDLLDSPQRLPQDTIGFCFECNGLVRRNAKAECENGHRSDVVIGAYDVAPEDEIPALPSFNWGAFFMPPIWGASHGVVISGLLVLPLWLFLDTTIQNAVYEVGSQTPEMTRYGVYAMTVLLTVLTIAFMAWFGKTGWAIAWRKEFEDGTSPLSMDEFIKREKRWYWICIPLFFALLGYAIFYWMTILPGVRG
jgi:hypothetical protein